MRQVHPVGTRPQQVERLHMTDLKYSYTTRAVRDAVVAWLDTDPTMVRVHADARSLDAAYDRLLPVLAAALWVSRGVDSNILAEIGDAERLVRPEDRADSRTHLLALKELVRAHPDTNAARLLAYHEAVALMQGGEPGSVEVAGFDLVDVLRHLIESHDDLHRRLRERAVLQASHDDLQRRLAERDAHVLALCDHLSRETKSAEAAGAIADELSAALEKSRERVAELETSTQSTRRALETCREAIEGCNDIDDLLHMRDMIGLTCNNAGLHRAVHPEDGPVYRWAADQGPPQ